MESFRRKRKLYIKFADILLDWGQKYNEAFICQELNNVGVVTSIKLKESGYQNLYYEKHMRNIWMGYVTQDIGDDLPGFTVGQNSRVEILMKLTNALQNKQLKVYSDKLFKELQTFIWKSNKPQAQKGYHDDLVMALALANNLYEASGKSGAYQAGDGLSMAAGFSRDTQQLNPVSGRYTDGTSMVPNKTSDGFWDAPSGGGQTGLKSELDSLRQMSSRQSNTHNYNHPQWRPFKWMLDD